MGCCPLESEGRNGFISLRPSSFSQILTRDIREDYIFTGNLGKGKENNTMVRCFWRCEKSKAQEIK
jgi:hypothetical protein